MLILCYWKKSVPHVCPQITECHGLFYITIRKVLHILKCIENTPNSDRAHYNTHVLQIFHGKIKGLKSYDLVNYNHTLYYSMFIVICPNVSFKETKLFPSVLTICKTGNGHALCLTVASEHIFETQTCSERLFILILKWWSFFSHNAYQQPIWSDNIKVTDISPHCCPGGQPWCKRTTCNVSIHQLWPCNSHSDVLKSSLTSMSHAQKWHLSEEECLGFK